MVTAVALLVMTVMPMALTMKLVSIKTKAAAKKAAALAKNRLQRIDHADSAIRS